MRKGGSESGVGAPGKSIKGQCAYSYAAVARRMIPHFGRLNLAAVAAGVNELFVPRESGTGPA